LATIAVCLVMLVIKLHFDDGETKPISKSEETRKLIVRNDGPADRIFPKRAFDTSLRSIESAPEVVPVAVPVPVVAAATPTFPPERPGGGVIPPLTPTASTNIQTGVIGRVTLRGQPPPERPILAGVPEEPFCGNFFKTSPTTHHFIVDDKGGLADTLVYVETDKQRLSSPTVPNAEFILTFKDCQIEPQVSAIEVGRKLQFRNSGRANHQPIITATNNPTEKINLLGPGRSQSVRLSKPEFFVKISCPFHPWEFAWVSVMQQPFAMTQTNGAFSIVLPEGNYKLRAAHRKAIASDQAVQEVKVVGGKLSTVDLTLDSPAQKSSSDRIQARVSNR
jgi:hypothetical protein